MKLFVPTSLQTKQSLYPLPVPANAASITSSEGQAHISLFFFLFVVTPIMFHKCICFQLKKKKKWGWGGSQVREEGGEKRGREAGRNNQLLPSMKVWERRCSLQLLSDLIKIYWKKKKRKIKRARRNGQEVESTTGLCGSGLASVDVGRGRGWQGLKGPWGERETVDMGL